MVGDAGVIALTASGGYQSRKVEVFPFNRHKGGDFGNGATNLVVLLFLGAGPKPTSRPGAEDRPEEISSTAPPAAAAERLGILGQSGRAPHGSDLVLGRQHLAPDVSFTVSFFWVGGNPPTEIDKSEKNNKSTNLLYPLYYWRT